LFQSVIALVGGTAPQNATERRGYGIRECPWCSGTIESGAGTPPVAHQDAGIAVQPNHDQLFHFVMRHPAIAAAWVRSVLAEEALIDWHTFAPAHERIPGIRLRTHVADLVFVARRCDRDEFVWFVIEHKGHPDPAWHEQTLRYCVHLRRVVQRAKGPLPSVVPLLLHHGPQALVEPRGAEPDPFVRFAPRLAVVVVDLAADPPSERDAGLPPLLRLLFRCLHAASRQTAGELLASIDDWRDLLRAVERSDGPPLPEDALDAVGWYLVEHSDLTEEQVLMALSKNLHQPEGIKMTTGQRIRAESRERGRAEGLAEGLAEGRAKVLLRQLARRFGPLPTATVQRVEQASVRELDVWLDRILDAASLADVLAD
jgi:hypothetical protein